MGQIKVRIERISPLCLKEKICQCDFHSKIVGVYASGIRFAAFPVRLGCTESRRKVKVTQL